MIRDLSQTLQTLLSQPGLPPELAAVNFSFDEPVEPFTFTSPTINLYLYDIRENTELRINEPTFTKQSGNVTVTQPPRRIQCTYLATAWVSQAQDMTLQQHRLLTQVLAQLSQFPTIPANLAVGLIKTNDPPAQLSVAVGTSATGISEFWTALGAKLRPSISIQATIALPVWPVPPPAPLAITSRVDIGQIQSDGSLGTTQSLFFVSGQVTNSDGSLASEASVTLVEVNQVVISDNSGVFRLGPVPMGVYTLRATSGSSSGQVSCTVPTNAATATYDVKLT
ncbi:MAG TPA: Pvc16 family protein [Gemmata sp.]|jgi:hypothetical protein|nr:Pvc16 family protein [Gemmata sp.]